MIYISEIIKSKKEMDMYRKFCDLIHDKYFEMRKIWIQEDSFKDSFDKVMEQLKMVKNNQEVTNLKPSEVVRFFHNDVSLSDSDVSPLKDHKKSFDKVMEQLKMVKNNQEVTNLKPSEVFRFFHNDVSLSDSDVSLLEDHKKSFDKVLQQLKMVKGLNHREVVNIKPSDVLHFFHNLNEKENDDGSATPTDEMSDDENYLYNNFSGCSKENDFMVEDNYYYNESGCPFDSFNLANWDGDQQVGFR